MFKPPTSVVPWTLGYVLVVAGASNCGSDGACSIGDRCEPQPDTQSCSDRGGVFTDGETCQGLGYGTSCGDGVFSRTGDCSSSSGSGGGGGGTSSCDPEVAVDLFGIDCICGLGLCDPLPDECLGVHQGTVPCSPAGKTVCFNGGNGDEEVTCDPATCTWTAGRTCYPTQCDPACVGGECQIGGIDC